MKILAIGDPHGRVDLLRKVPKNGVDLILVTGDIGKADLARQRFFENVKRKHKGLSELEDDKEFDYKVSMEVYNSSMNVLNYLRKVAPVFLIYGNVESYGGRRPEKNRKAPWLPHEIIKMSNVSVINNRVRNFKGIRIGGLEFFVDTNWVRDFKPGDFKKKMARARKSTDKARRVLNRFKDIDILLHHQPPYGFLDKVGGNAPKHWHGKHAGSKVILDYIKKFHPRYSFCGHIHEGKGMTKIGNTEVYNMGVGGYKIVEL